MNREPWTQAGPKVRWRIVPDEEQYDASYIDTWNDLDAEQKAEEKRLILAQCDREGVWGYQIEVLKDVLCPHCKGVTHQEWEHEDSCWSFVGYDAAKSECDASMNVYLDVLPLDGTLHIREAGDAAGVPANALSKERSVEDAVAEAGDDGKGGGGK